MTIRHLTHLFGLALVLAALLPGGTANGLDKEFYVNTYRSIGTVNARGQRSAAMGRTGAGLADGAASLAINPAGLGAFTGYAIEGGVGVDWLDDGSDSTDQNTFRLGGAASLERWRPHGGPNQTVGAMVYHEKYNGATGSDMGRKQTSFTGGYGIHLMDDIVAGVSASLFDGDWDASYTNVPFQRSFTGGEFKVGAIYRASDQLTFGGVLGYSVGSYNEKGPNAPASSSGNLNRWDIQAGVGYQLCDETLLAGDLWYDNMRTKIDPWLHERNRAWGLSLGIEQQVLPETLALRGGLYYDHTSYSSHGLVTMFDQGRDFSKSRFGFTAGAAVNLYGVNLGYSLDINTKGDVKNLFDISAEW